MKLIADMIASALRTSWRMLMVIVFLISIAFNASTAAVGLSYSVVASVVEAVTDLPQVGSVRSKETAAKDFAEGLAKLKRKVGSLEGEVARLKMPKKVMFEGVEIATEEAVAKVSNRVKARTAKVASADMGATFGQSIPWIGIAVVVAATTYDLKTACDTMKDMHALEVAVHPEAANDSSVKEVCGLKVPSKEEIWAKVKASPGQAWDWAKAAVPDVPEMPDMPEIDWTFWN